MLFSHYLLDEIVNILYHFNPMKYQLDREGSYDSEASLIFSYAYLLVPKPGVKIADESIDRLARYIKITFISFCMCTEEIDEELYGVLAQTILESAQDIEMTLNTDQTAILMFDGKIPVHDDDIEDASFIEVPDVKKWSVN